MNPDWSEKEVFLRARALTGSAREAWLAVACRTPEQRAAIDALLRSEESTIDPFSAMPQPSVGSSALPPSSGGGGGVSAVLDDRYEVLEVLGEGGQGVVVLGWDRELGRKVAIKRLKGDFVHSPEALIRLREEAERTGRLSHSAIVPIFDANFRTQPFYIVSEYVPGMTLARHIDAEAQRRRSEGVGLRREWTDFVVATLIPIADALECAHREELVHRDVKPSNILVDPARGARLTDFGIAKSMQAPDLTETGRFLGTCFYVSPEQAAESASAIDARSDVFSLGAVMYEALTLTRPFNGPSVTAVLRAVMEHEPPRLRRVDPAVPRDLETICRKAMEKDRRQRYWTAGQLAADLRCFVDGVPILASPPSPARAAHRWARRHRAATAMAAIVALATALAAVLLIGWLSARAQACRLTITTVPTGAGIFVAPFEPGSDQPGEMRRVGTSPLREARLPAGRYRVLALLDGGTFAECDVRFHRPASSDARALVLRTTADVVAAAPMVRIEAGSHALGSGELQGALQELRQVFLPAFHVDASPVSNRDYLLFLRAQQPPADPPEFWPERPDAAFLDLPAVRLTPEQMEAYADWSSKRLPTASEWEAVLRGGTNRRFPWGDAAPESWAVVDDADRRVAGAANERLQMRHYLRYVRAVSGTTQGSSAGAQGDVRWLIGNTREMTSTWDLETGWVVVVKGASWLDDSNQFDPATAFTQPGTTGSYHIGFRCVRSAVAAHLRPTSNKDQSP